MFSTLMLSVLGVISVLFVRVRRAEVGGLQSEMVARFDAVDARFETVTARFESLDRDVHALVKHTFGIDRG